MYILEVANDKAIEVEIALASLKDMPLKKKGWNFNWRAIIKKQGSTTYVLRTRLSPKEVQGVIQLNLVEGMLVMDLVEIAPHNIGTKMKKYDRVAGILIAFGCRESLKLETEYKGFLTFHSKTQLVELYRQKYGAKLALGQRMYIEPSAGIKLIHEFLD